MATQITTHVADAQQRWVEALRDKPLLAGLLAALVQQVQDCEDALFDVQELRDLLDAAGLQLDRLGADLGESRLGRTDADYRVAIEQRILRNSAEGTAERLIQVVLDATTATDVHLTELLAATFFVVDANGDPIVTDAELLALVRTAKPAGVGCAVVVSSGFPFVYASVLPGLDDPYGAAAGGYSSVVFPTTGGEYARVAGLA